MQDRDLYAKLLGLEPPWEVVDVDISLADHSVQVFVALRAGARSRFTALFECLVIEWLQHASIKAATVRGTNSFGRPNPYPEGIPYERVNGVLVIDGGEHTGARPGRAILGRGHDASKP